jgi:hypothetical protein
MFYQYGTDATDVGDAIPPLAVPVVSVRQEAARSVAAGDRVEAAIDDMPSAPKIHDYIVLIPTLHEFFREL